MHSKVAVVGGKRRESLDTGFDLLPGVIIDQHFTQPDRLQRLSSRARKLGTHVGLGIDEATALLVDQRFMKVVGDGNVMAVFAAGRREQLQVQEYQADALIDLTSLRRIVRDSQLPAFPPAKAADPVVEKGTLMIVGGGRMPIELVKEFIETAGGEEAHIVVLPTSMPDPLPKDYGKRMFEAGGAKNVTVLTQRTRSEVESSDVLEALKRQQMEFGLEEGVSGVLLMPMNIQQPTRYFTRY